MEVSGRKENSPGVSSKQSDIFCQPCGNDGQNVEAEGFCQNCKEYLCTACITHHRKVTLSRKHVILDNKNMPTNVQQQSPAQVCTEICEKHPTEVVKFFCKQHETVGCSACMVLEHKSCKVDYIPEITEAFLAGSELDTLVEQIYRFQTDIKSASDEIGRNEKEADKACLEAVNDIRTFRKEINDYLDRMEQRLLDKCDKIKQENSTIIKKTLSNFKAIDKELNTIHAQLTSNAEQATDMFVKARKASSTLKTLETRINAAYAMSNIRVWEHKRSQVVSEVVTKNCPLGEIKVRNIGLQERKLRTKSAIVNAIPKRKGFIDVKSSSDITTCYISGMIALNDTTLACADFYNLKVKLIDIARGTLSSEITVEPTPWDLTLVPDEEIAVTLCTKKKIQFLTYKQRLFKCRFINVNGVCRGIAHSNNRLVVSYEGDPKVEILTLEGIFLQHIKTDNTGIALFMWPLYVAVSCNAEFIFVSDSTAKSVIKLTFDGQVLATYKDSDIQYPGQLVACEYEYLLVCNDLNGTVQLVSPEGKTLRNILVTNGCLALCYDESSAMLYTSDSNGNRITVYKMT